MIQKLMRCTKCDQVVPHPASLEDFEKSSFLPGVEWSDADLERQREFFRCHGAHPVEELRVNADTYISDKPSYEAVKVSYFEASNGQQSFLIRRTKPALDQPAIYQLIPGKLLVSNVSFTIQEEALRKQMAARNGFAPLTEEKIQKFIRAFRDEVETIGPEMLAEEVELAEEGETPLLSYGIFKDARWESVLRRCAKDFEKADLNKVKKFIDENSQPEDVLSLLVERKVSIFFPCSGQQDSLR
jgi:hypothetical protein